jgi:TonB family protein
VGLAAAGGAAGVALRGPRAAGAAQAATMGGLATTGAGNVGLGAKQEGRVAVVKAEAPEVDGKLDGDAVARVVRSRMRMVEDCYQRELKRNPQLQGRVEIELTIDAEGSVQNVRVAANATGSPEVAECIVSRIQRWKFPKPAGGSVTVTFPFLFTSSG